eukprot:gnl/TRDRNA2_/TRDRNA2_135019_c0_seq1.p1 gnl/TRDRNA2_/TRDRNA2_135019_c0~~gnl/TRDRNA2_/TRDRNA2_135019_c0_seq1.p1  ORF type:complete len:343 (-),score=50.96 gnl/TRDRNA2_/TRDRNA2_135019_c0_seq1:139-1167(-)
MRNVVLILLLASGTPAHIAKLAAQHNANSKLARRPNWASNPLLADYHTALKQSAWNGRASRHASGLVSPLRSTSDGNDWHPEILQELAYLPPETREGLVITYEYLVNKPWDQRLAWEEADYWKANAEEWQEFAAFFLDVASQAGPRWKEAVPEWTDEALEGLRQRAELARAMEKRAVKSVVAMEIASAWKLAARDWDTPELKKPEESGEWTEAAVKALATAAVSTAIAMRQTADRAGGAGGKSEELWEWASLGGVGWADATQAWDRAAIYLGAISEYVNNPALKWKPDVFGKHLAEAPPPGTIRASAVLAALCGLFVGGAAAFAAVRVERHRNTNSAMICLS